MMSSLLDHLDKDALKKILGNAIAAGVVDEKLNPVSSSLACHEAILNGATFEVPPETDRAQYLSEGGYGVVCKCRVLNPKRYHGCDQIAVKKVSLPHEKAFDNDWEDNIRLLREIHFMKHLPHPNITPIVSIYMNKEAQNIEIAREEEEDQPVISKPSKQAKITEEGNNKKSKMKSPAVTAADKVEQQLKPINSKTQEALKKNLKCFYIVMPLYTPGSIDMMGIIRNEKQFCSIMRDCVSGLLWMHRHKVLHRDIKRENIFYDAKNQNAIIADLGMARSTKKHMTGGRECSTKSYLAPELIMETTESYSFPVDIWALGCVFYEMLVCNNESSSMFAETNPYHLILARQYSINRTAFKTKLGRKRITYGVHNIQQLATQEASWVKKKWVALEKQLDNLCAPANEKTNKQSSKSTTRNDKKQSLTNSSVSNIDDAASSPDQLFADSSNIADSGELDNSDQPHHGKMPQQGPWDSSMKQFLLEDIIKKCLQFYPAERITAQELADVLKNSRVCKLAGKIHMPKKMNQKTVTETFLEDISKLETEAERGMKIREHLFELTLQSKKEDEETVKMLQEQRVSGSGTLAGVNPFLNKHSKSISEDALGLLQSFSGEPDTSVLDNLPNHVNPAGPGNGSTTSGSSSSSAGGVMGSLFSRISPMASMSAAGGQSAAGGASSSSSSGTTGIYKNGSKPSLWQKLTNKVTGSSGQNDSSGSSSDNNNYPYNSTKSNPFAESPSEFSQNSNFSVVNNSRELLVLRPTSPQLNFNKIASLTSGKNTGFTPNLEHSNASQELLEDIAPLTPTAKKNALGNNCSKNEPPRKATPAAKRRNARQALALPTIDENNMEEEEEEEDGFLVQNTRINAGMGAAKKNTSSKRTRNASKEKENLTAGTSNTSKETTSEPAGKKRRSTKKSTT